ncbi:MAG: outer membrane beta-barrel protein [Mariprofundaceae bacterium]|nr:outer membrane beta-barrel protein [Mariprofundaceae bacterium]
MLRLSIFMLALLCSSQAVQAEPFNQRGAAFLGISLAQFNLDYKETKPVFSQKNSMAGMYLYTGANFNEFAGFETRFGFTNTATTTLANNQTLGFSVDALQSYLFRANWDIDSKWRVVGLVGYTDAQISRKTSNAGGSQKISKRGMSYGASISYAVSNSFHADVEWLSYWTNVDTGANTTMSLNNLGLRLGYHF